MRQEPLEILALALPCGQGSLPSTGRLERVLNEFFETRSCWASLGFAWQRNCKSLNFTSFREHFSLQRKF